MMELIKFDGSRIYESDVRKDNLHNIYWVTAEGTKIPIPNLADSHLRNIALMLMGFSFTKFNRPDRLKVLWLTALRLEWERRQPISLYNSLVKQEEGVTLSELKRLETILQWAKGKTFTDSVMDEIISLQNLVKSEIKLKLLETTVKTESKTEGSGEK